MPPSGSGARGRARSGRCRGAPSLQGALRGLYALALLLALAVAVLGALAFRKVDSISSRISSAQACYEERLLRIQEDLQALGEWPGPAPGEAFSRCSSSRE
ncbi:scavenger receptor class A member 3-like protein [Pitangus sulphuratus]|nr:scavenger receptor class A member 3-like protein [Pitangus sulphuratus]